MSCPMSFGEINIPSSRAFWDDCEEDEIPNTAEKLELKYETGQTAITAPVDLLLVIEGVDISEFAEGTVLMDAIKICTVPAGKRSGLYSIPGKSMLIAVLDEDLTNSGEVTELLWHAALAREARQVLTLTVKAMVNYKTENIAKVCDEITILRGVNSKLDYVEDLKTPNFIAGVAAGIASWRECEQLPVSAYVAYTDNLALDHLAAKPIIRLLQDSGVKCSTTYVPKWKDDSHLYS